MALPINDTAAFRQYTATAGQTVFTVPFEFFENADLQVYQNDTLLALTTQYTVTGAGVDGGGAVTLVSGAALSDTITIVRDVAVKRITDFPTSGPFEIESLNTELSKVTAMVGQQETKIDQRVLRLADFDTPGTLNALPSKAERLGKLLAFDSLTGQPIASAGPDGAGGALRDVVSIMDFGADGGGTVIDTAALQALVAEVGTYSGDLGKAGYLPSGLYRLDATTAPQSYSRLFGLGPHASILRNDAGFQIPTIPCFTAAGALTFATFEDMGARGQKSFIDVAGTTDHNTFRNVVATGMADAGFRFRGMLQTSLFDRIMVESSPFGVVCESAICNRNTFREPEFKDLTDASFWLKGSEDLLIIGGRFEGSGDAAKSVFLLEGTQEITLLGGYFENCHKTIVTWTNSPAGSVTFDAVHFTYFTAGVSFLWQNNGGQLIFRNCRATEPMEVPAGSIVENCINIYKANIDVASASTTDVPASATVARITGTTNIDSLTNGTQFIGQRRTLIFTDALTVNDGTGNLKLAGNLTATADDTLSLVSDGTNWFETSRSVN